LIKGSIQEDITIVNICAPNLGTPNYIKKNINRHKGETGSNTIKGDVNTLLTSMYRSSRQKNE